MDQLQERDSFRPGQHRLNVVLTDLTESEALIRQMAQNAQAAHPEDFAGKTPCVFFKMPYIPPYETFRELRQLILCIRENTGLRSHFRGLVAIEVTAWLGHEREEYFTVLLKYLYDHSGLWQPAFVLNSATEVQLRRFLSACARYITPRCLDVCLFSRPDRLREMIRREYSRQGGTITREAAEMLAQTLARSEFRHAWSLALIERSAQELRAYSGSGGILKESAVREYLADPDSTLTMIAGDILSDERSVSHDAEMLRLRG